MFEGRLNLSAKKNLQSLEAKSDLRLEPKIDISLGRLFYSIYSNRLSATKNENVFYL